MSGMFWIALELSIPNIVFNVMLSLPVKKLDAFKFDGVAESDNTGVEKAPPYGKLHCPRPCWATRTGQYLLDWYYTARCVLFFVKDYFSPLLGVAARVVRSRLGCRSSLAAPASQRWPRRWRRPRWECRPPLRASAVPTPSASTSAASPASRARRWLTARRPQVAGAVCPPRFAAARKTTRLDHL